MLSLKKMAETIAAIQEEIIEEFVTLAEDVELSLYYLIDQGEKLPPLLSTGQKDQYLIKGCQAKVWLLSDVRDERVYYRAQSDAAVTRGLVSLLLRIFSGQRPSDILQAELFFPSRIQMQRFIGTQRTGGFAQMLTQIKRYALVYTETSY